MALIQSDWALGRKNTVRPQTAGAVHAQIFSIDVPAAGIAVGDIVELGYLPAYARIVDALLFTTGATAFPAAAATIALLTGQPSETTNDDGSARQFEAALPALFDAVDVSGANNAIVRLTSPWLVQTQLYAGPFDRDRSIGLSFSVAVPFEDDRALTLQLLFTQ